MAGDVCVDCHDCATCTNVEPYSQHYEIVYVDLSVCKGSAISWFCCKYSQKNDGPKDTCEIFNCDGKITFGKHKCEEATTLQYIVPIGTTSITVQLHDGKFIGNLTCNKKGDCCGGIDGSCKYGINSACQTTIQLSSCRTTPPPTPLPVPSPTPPPTSPPVPLSTPECQSHADCNHLNNVCSKGICDSHGSCVTHFYDESVVCRNSTGPCDAEEKCTNSSKDCPTDVVKDSNTLCSLVVNRCDLPEICDGTNKHCPDPNLQLQEGYVVKCGTIHYLCGVELKYTFEQNNSLFLQTCNLGVVREIVEMVYPSCLSQTPLEQNTCIDGKGVSNYALSQCEPNTSKIKWPCLGKMEVSK